MRLLIDQNIWYRIVPKIAFLFKELVHVKSQGWVDWKDYDIFMSARKLQYDAVITLDEDFNKLLLEHGTPPKIIWIKTGNCSTTKLTDVIVSHKE
jgi:predicted nuclease of predicted toxin-antitoxin system